MSANHQVTPPQVAQGQQGQVAPQLPPPGQGHQHDAGQLPPPLLAGQGHPQVIPGWLPPQGNAQQGPGQQLPGYFQHHQAQNYVGQAPQFNQGAAQGVYNAMLNNNFAMNRAMWAEQQAMLAMQQCEALKKAHGRAERWARDLRITQEQGKYKSPADKRPVGYLLEEQFDLKEL